MQNETIQIGSVTLSLDEAEETLSAIREGKIDAVVVEGNEGDEVYTFRDPSHPFRLLIEAMSEGAVLATLDGIICYQNPRFSEMVGEDVAANSPRSLQELVIPEQRAQLETVLERGRIATSRGNVELVGGAGRPLPVQLSVSRARLVDLDVFCVVVTDLSAQRKQEQLYLTARREIEARDRLLSVVAHELRNPLGVLEMQTQLLENLLRKLGSGEAAQKALTMVDRLRSQGRRLGQLVSRILDVGSIGAGRLNIAREEVDLADVVKGVVDRSSREIAASGSTLTLDLEPASGRWDRIRIEQVVDNLLSNAIKYGLGQPIRIAVTTVDGSSVRLTVEDRGRGIPAEAQERIFRPYERMAESSGVPGLGIGLFVTAEIVKAHGGTLRVQTTSFGGSLFVVELPLRGG